MYFHSVRFLRLATACVAILVGTQDWANAQFIPETNVEVLPANPTSNDNISIRISGLWNTGCVPSNPKASISVQSIRIDTSSPGETCTLSFAPWSMTVFIGRLPAGSYDVSATYSGPYSVKPFAQRTFTVTSIEGQNQSPWFGQNPARKELVFPFFLRAGPLGDGYNSVFDVINPNSSSAVVTFSFFDSTGKSAVPVTASGQGTFLGPAQLRIDGYAVGRVLFSFAGNGDFAGSAFVSSTQPVIVQEEISHHVLDRSCPICLAPPFTKLKSRILAPAPLAARRQTLRVKFTPGQPWTNTAVALVFSWSPPPVGTLAALRAVGRLIFRNDNGIVLAEKTLTLGVNEQLIGFVSDLFPGIAANGLSGSLECIFDQEIFLTAVQVTTFGEEETWEGPNLGAAALQTLP